MKTAELAFVALGSNQGNSVEIIRAAFVQLQLLTDAPLLPSSLWRTMPVNCPPGSPPFVNAAAGLLPRGNETPASLLEKLQDLEKKFGRQPKQILNEPRPLDLDLIAFASQTSNAATLTLPHPRAHLRKFVLQPLNEIAPDLILPGQTKTVEQLLRELKTEEMVERL